MMNLSKGNEIRLKRARQREVIRGMDKVEGRKRIAAILLNPSPTWQSARLDYVLRMPKRSGPKFSRHVRAVALDNMGVLAGDLRLKELTHKQRQNMAWYILDLKDRY